MLIVLLHKTTLAIAIHIAALHTDTMLILLKFSLIYMCLYIILKKISKKIFKRILIPYKIKYRAFLPYIVVVFRI